MGGSKVGPVALVPLAATIPVAAGAAVLTAVTIAAVASGVAMAVVASSVAVSAIHSVVAAAAITIVGAGVPVPRLSAVALACALAIRAGGAGITPVAVATVGVAIAGGAYTLGPTDLLRFDHLAGRVVDDRKLRITRGGNGEGTSGIDADALTGCDVHAGPRLCVRDIHLPSLNGHTSSCAPTANDKMCPLHDRCHMGCHDCEVVHISLLYLHCDLTVMLMNVRESLAVPVKDLNHGVPG